MVTLVLVKKFTPHYPLTHYLTHNNTHVLTTFHWDSIMSTTGKFGPTDLGRNGISNFFHHHVCNSFCGQRGWLLPKNCQRLFAPQEGTLTR